MSITDAGVRADTPAVADEATSTPPRCFIA
jgi:hypothetical protein